MHRYYMTAETRQAVIAESNRLIAARAATQASRRRPETDRPAEVLDSEWDVSQGSAQASDLESAFARLVLDLQSTSTRLRPS